MLEDANHASIRIPQRLHGPKERSLHENIVSISSRALVIITWLVLY